MHSLQSLNEEEAATAAAADALSRFQVRGLVLNSSPFPSFGSSRVAKARSAARRRLTTKLRCELSIEIRSPENHRELRLRSALNDSRTSKEILVALPR